MWNSTLGAYFIGILPLAFVGCSRVSPVDRPAAGDIARLGGKVELNSEGGIRGIILTYLRADDSTMQVVKSCDDLEFLKVEQTQVTDRGIECLVGMTRLQSVSLYNTSIGDRGLRFLSEVESIRELGLNATKVTDAGVSHLAKLPNLERPFLDQTQITDQCVASLKTMTNLKVLGLRQTRITSHGLRLLKESLRETQIYSGGDPNVEN
jgi:hypothetical protein